jgi:hypothetical protein
MAHWGVAYALGPNYNLPWHKMDPNGRAKALAGAFDATAAALADLDGATAIDKALVRALPTRYPQREPIEELAPWNDAFANATRTALAAHPGNDAIATDGGFLRELSGHGASCAGALRQMA